MINKLKETFIHQVWGYVAVVITGLRCIGCFQKKLDFVWYPVHEKRITFLFYFYVEPVVFSLDIGFLRLKISSSGLFCRDIIIKF